MEAPMSVERIKALEVQQVNDSQKLDDVLHALRAQGSDIEEIKLSLGRQRGYMAGAMSVVVGIWTVVLATATLMWDNIIEAISAALR